MAQRGAIIIPAKDVTSKLTFDLKLTGVQRMMWRARLFGFLVRVIAPISPVKVEIEIRSED